MKIISKTIKLLPVFLLVLGLSGCSDDDDGYGGQPVVCTANAGTLTADATPVSLSNGSATISATANGDIVVPSNYEVTYVLTSGTNLVIEAAGATPSFDVTEAGSYTIHTLVAETSDASSANYLDLGVINFGTTTGGDVLNIVSAAGICAALDVTGAPIEVTFNIVDLALDNGLTSLAAALTATDLVTTLQGTGPFTVFAPTNEAFTTLLTATGIDLGNMSEDENALVTNILLNHVIIGETLASTDLVSAGSGYTNTAATGPNGENLSLYFTTEGGVNLNGISTVDSADNIATNGIVHVVDAVITLPTIATFATSNPALSNLVGALALADSGTPTVNWINTVSGTENANLAPFTVFAPTNDAFAALLLELDATGNTALGDLDPALVDSVLTFHVVAGSNVQSGGLGDLNGVIPTLGGNLSLDGVVITDDNERDINILAPDLVDIQAINGVVHVVDRVILPPLQ